MRSVAVQNNHVSLVGAIDLRNPALMTSKLLSAAIFVSLVGPAGEALAAKAGCFEDWTVASEIVAREKLLAVEELRGPAISGGTIVRASLCQDGDRFVYRLIVTEPNGRLRRTEVEARAK